MPVFYIEQVRGEARLRVEWVHEDPTKWIEGWLLSLDVV